ncbi:MAG: YdeI/OmpD-associated family protein [Nonlabens sp.]
MKFKFETTLGTDGFMGALLIPATIAKQLEELKVKRVIALVRSDMGHIEFHAGIAKKRGTDYIMFSKAKQKELNIGIGETMQVVIQEDTTRYQAPMTEELEAVLSSDYEGFELFESMLPGKRRNIIFMVFNQKSSQKRINIALNALENLKMGNTDPFKFKKIIPY